MPSILQGRGATTPVAASSENATMSNPVYIAGVVLICLIASGVGIWLGIRYYKKWRQAKMEAKDVGFLSIKGLVPDQPMDEKGLQRSATQKNGFSREQLNAAIPMPEKSLPPRHPGPTASREEIIGFHRQSGILPQPFAAKPFSFALNSSPTRSSFASSDGHSRQGSKFRNSFSLASGAGNNRQSVFSLMSTQTTGSDIQASQGLTRKVRQAFEPVLPDEFVLKPGEFLTIVQSFDDGWCVVGRENPFANTQQTSLFKPKATEDQANVELGCVPAWCFLKPVQGLRAERPMRSSSLGITVNMDGPATRNDLMSWSNF